VPLAAEAILAVFRDRDRDQDVVLRFEFKRMSESGTISNDIARILWI
jgi:hypothetical protein